MVKTIDALGGTSPEGKVGQSPVRDYVDVRFVGDYIARGCGSEAEGCEDCAADLLFWCFYWGI